MISFQTQDTMNPDSTNPTGAEPNKDNNTSESVPPLLGRKHFFCELNLHNESQNGAKKSKVVPVVEQFKELSFHGNNFDTQTAPEGKNFHDLDTISTKVSDRELVPWENPERFFEVATYQQDILHNLRESEKRHRPDPHYMRKQIHITHRNRSLLIDWLVATSEARKLDTETLYLAVSYLDRFMSRMMVKRRKLCLVGAAALCLAAKYEERVCDFGFLVGGNYHRKHVLRKERSMLRILSFDLCTPTAHVFINTYAVLCDMPDKLKYLTLYISELSLMMGGIFMPYLPSIMASASLALARHVLDMEMWTPQLEEISSYKLQDMKTVICQLSRTHSSAKDLVLKAIRVKYTKEKYKTVAMIEAIKLTEDDMDQICQSYLDEDDDL